MRRSASQVQRAVLNVAVLGLAGVAAVGTASGDSALTITASAAATPQGQVVTFTFSPKVAAQGDSVKFNFGDGTSQTIAYSAVCQSAGGCDEITHLYAQAGTYAVTGNGTIGGVTVSGSVAVTVANLTITPSPSTVTPGQPVTFTFTPNVWTASDSLTFWWGDGSSDQTTGSPFCQIVGGCNSISHTYTQSGVFGVAAGGAIGDVPVFGTTQVAVQSVCTSPVPSAAFTVGSSAIRPWEPVQFTDLSTGSPTSWSWDFGDGSAALGTVDGTSDKQNPVYTFNRAGTFTVTLTATNCKGSAQTQTSVSVLGDCTAHGGSGTGCWSGVGPYGGYVTALAEAPSAPATVYAAIRDEGVFRSPDGGATWSRTGVAIPTRFVTGFAIDAVNPMLAYAAGAPLLRTLDGGATWATMNLGLPPFCTTVLAADPQTTNTAWLGACTGLFRTADGGATWPGVTFDGVARGVAALAVDPTHGDTVYAIANGLRKTVDGGAHWQLLDNLTIAGTSPYWIAIDPKNPATVYVSTNGGGVFKTADGGTTWAALDTHAGGVGSVAIQLLALDPNHSGTVFIEADTGVFRSTDGGASWTRLTPRTDVTALVPDPSTSGRFLAGLGGGGVLVSADGGSSWSLSSTGLVGVYVNAMVTDPNSAKTVYAATEDQWVLKTTDGGVTWSASGIGAANALALDPSRPGTVYAGAANAVMKTTDGGATWSNPSAPGAAVSGQVVGLGLSPANPWSVYAATELNGVFKSTDGGTSWTAANSGIGDTSPTPATVAVAVDPTSADVAYLATGHLGVFKTTTGGAAWSPVNTGLPVPPLPFPGSFAVDPAVPAMVYVGMSNTSGSPAGVYRTLDGGQHWSATGGRIVTLSILSLAIDPAERSTVYAGTQGGGVFRSTDAGATWQWMGDGLGSLTVTSIAFDGGNPNVLYAGTAAGVYTTTVTPPPARLRRHLRRVGP
ncbi:MAG TPA: PKD domain-containing protein [Thermoanaerobaculaceae bacterium]|nr:PKD domain-containing protein [Thermoanaerobaculaceae bacterium]